MKGTGKSRKKYKDLSLVHAKLMLLQFFVKYLKYIMQNKFT